MSRWVTVLGLSTLLPVAPSCIRSADRTVPVSDTVWLEAIDRPEPQRWADIAGNPFSAAFHADFSYRDAKVRVTYRRRGPTFAGVLEASGLKPNFAYQVKLLGDRSDTWSFEAIGYHGRWLIGEGRRTNFSDDDYEAQKSRPDVEIESYILFDYFVTDDQGRAAKSLVLERSYHVIWNQKLNRWHRAPGRHDSPLFTHRIRPAGRAYWWKVEARPVTVGLWLEEEWVNEQPSKDALRLPAGTYRVSLSMNNAGAWELTVLKQQEFHVLPLALEDARPVFPYLNMALTPAPEGLFALVVQWGPEAGRVAFRAAE